MSRGLNRANGSKKAHVKCVPDIHGLHSSPRASQHPAEPSSTMARDASGRRSVRSGQAVDERDILATPGHRLQWKCRGVWGRLGMRSASRESLASRQEEKPTRLTNSHSNSVGSSLRLCTRSLSRFHPRECAMSSSFTARPQAHVQLLVKGYGQIPVRTRFGSWHDWSSRWREGGYEVVSSHVLSNCMDLLWRKPARRQWAKGEAALRG
jgi:hypothetical protein